MADLSKQSELDAANSRVFDQLKMLLEGRHVDDGTLTIFVTNRRVHTVQVNTDSFVTDSDGNLIGITL